MNISPELLSVTTALALMSHGQAHAVDASKSLSMGAASIAASPIASIEGGPLVASQYFAVGATLVVVGIGAAIGDTVSVIVENSVDGSKAVLSASAAVTKDLSLAVGSGVKAVATSTGYALMASGKLLAFVPNEVGKQMLYQSKISR